MGAFRKTRLLRFLVRVRAWRRWFAVLGFGLGLASYFLVERQPAAARWISIALLTTWVLLLAEGMLGRYTRALQQRLPRDVLRFSAQMIHQESFFFVLPFFFTTTTWWTGQAGFAAALTAAGAVSILDPLYHGVMVRNRAVYLGYHALALFAVTLTALPIIVHLTTAQSYALACGAVVVFACPSLATALNGVRRGRWALLAVLGLALGGIAWSIRPWVPPATLWLTRASVSVTLDEEDREPGFPLREVTTATLDGRGLYAYTAIHAPRGLNEKVYHVWLQNGRVVDRIELEITGGRERGYRSWSHKTAFPEDAAGDWRVRVMTEGGQLIGVVRFTAV